MESCVKVEHKMLFSLHQRYVQSTLYLVNGGFYLSFYSGAFVFILRIQI